ncbi:ATP-dependent DNA helicase RecG [Terribacillus saccharophilus]|uniref:ATP-dependent DNA helicase RecG n=1 Tax=Terribacillus saccharophilus TaxID=361277 RepID=A0A268HCZ9_9BACI|nr:ATP-dependent DNA helicase RecG [Terribacillus saccharophilus]
MRNVLKQPVDQVKGIGAKLAEGLANMGIFTVEDLLFHLPYRYDVFDVQPLAELIHDDKVTIEGEIASPAQVQYYGRKKNKLTVTLLVENVAVKAIMFNRAFAQKQLMPGKKVTMTGKWDQHRLQLTVSNFKVGGADELTPVQPVYGVKGTVTVRQLQKSVKQALEQYDEDIEEILPESFLTSYKMPDRKTALYYMHFPPDRQALAHGRRRFTYEEFLLFQLKMQFIRKQKREASAGGSLAYDHEQVQAFVATLPFTLTNAQQRVLKDIMRDLHSSYRMNRLLQGDVGSGKTAVAAVALYAAVTAGKQGAIMVPTEILAEQHAQSLTSMLDGFATVALLTGSVKGKRRKAVLEQIVKGEVDIVVGTHALIQDEVHFKDLALAIVDEQHRFGVAQRRTLRDKGLHPDVLFMTATPIPRTLAITAFGDMDVSAIDEMPAGRKEIETYWVKENTIDRVLDFIRKEVAAGHQAYVISPLIEESDKLDIQNAVDLHQMLAAVFEPDIRVGLMHGRLPSDEKDAVMKEFADNETQVLVSTTVVEVGVNVPNATLMIIYDAERFGLSQLHQLRGRVGRGDAQSYCILIAEPKGEIGKERMRIMTETTNGFELSEQDLQLRGPGDFFGKKQSGIPEFKVGDMVHDYRALETARKDAEQIIAEERMENDPAYRNLLQALDTEFALNGNVLD